MGEAASIAAIQGFTDKYRLILKVVLIVVIAILISYIIYRIVRAFKKPVNATYVQGGGPIPIGWDPKIITTRLFDAIDGTMNVTDWRDALRDFNNLNDNQIIGVYNQWIKDGHDTDKKYYLFPYGSLTAAIKDKGNILTFMVQEKDVALANLERLHLV